MSSPGARHGYKTSLPFHHPPSGVYIAETLPPTQKKQGSKLEAFLVCLALPTNSGTEIIRTHRNLFLNNSECKQPVDSED